MSVAVGNLERVAKQMKTVALWQAEKGVEDFLPKEPTDCCQYFLNHYHLHPATIKVDGEKIECILVSGVKPILAVKRYSGEIILIRLSAVETISVKNISKF